MSNLTTVEYLSQIKDIDLRIRSLEGELHDTECEADKEYQEELISRIRADIEKYKRIKLTIRQQIQELGDNRSSVLLTEYYVRGKSWEQVADALGMKSIKHVREGMHKRAIELFSKKYEKII
ncbi:MAG: hypothetical protein IKO47_08740 [Ruminococcus sp.]|nr:hypothetical protein [Ruminococcus sp.]